MCHKSCIDYGRGILKREFVEGKSVLEVGSLDVNGSLRNIIEELKPRSYVGFDICPGKGVDVVCDANNLLEYFSGDKFDLLVSTELLEHVRDWRKVISNFKNIIDVNGMILLTTRSKGVKFHGYPFDFWRFEVEDMKYIFSDFNIKSLCFDPMHPGVFLFAQKPVDFKETDISPVRVYSIIKKTRQDSVTDIDIYWFRFKWVTIYRPLEILRKIAGLED